MAHPFLQAKHFQPTDGRAIDLIVVHTMEAPEKGNTAENVANYFRNPTRRENGRIKPVAVSAHYCIDNNSIVQCVRDQDVAFAAPGGNRNGLHLEHAGFARSTADEWNDDFSRALLALSAKLAAEKAERFNVPIRWLSPDDLKARRRGFTSHLNLSLAFKPGGHNDPGKHFPIEHYLDLVRVAMGQPALGPGVNVEGAITLGHPKLQNGADGNEVRHLQRLLGGLKVDGNFGPITEARLRDVQARARLTETGVCDAQTWAQIHPMLRRGDSGLAVQELQAALPDDLEADGDFGPKTEKAVARFQEANDLSADGVVSAAVWKALLK